MRRASTPPWRWRHDLDQQRSLQTAFLELLAAAAGTGIVAADILVGIDSGLLPEARQGQLVFGIEIVVVRVQVVVRLVPYAVRQLFDRASEQGVLPVTALKIGRAHV